MRTTIAIIVLIIVGICSTASADIFYVSPNGDDANDGLTLATAWRTIQRATNTVAPGDIVEIQSGIYKEAVDMKISGTPDKHITFRACGEVIVDAEQIRDYCLKLEGAHYIRIEGIVFRNSTDVGILLCNAKNNILIRNVSYLHANKGIEVDSKSTGNELTANIANVAYNSLSNSPSSDSSAVSSNTSPIGPSISAVLQSYHTKKMPKYAEGEILVKFKPWVLKNRISNLNSRAGAKALKVIQKVSIHRLKSTKGMSTKELLEIYRKDPDVEYAEPNYILNIDANPNDPDYPLLWGLNNIGQTGGVADADIDAPEAWDYLSGYWPDVVVAVIDTGVDYNHPDLADNMWTNAGEIPGDGIDNDYNGYIDDYRGWDFYNNDNDPFDDHYHGTHCAGTIAAVGYNGIGVIGVNYKAKIMPLKFLSASGSGYTSDAVEAILYAAANGAKVMSNSWGGGGYSTALQDAITTAYADGNGALFVASAGNSYSDNDLTAHYPSSYDVPNVVAVAATNHNDYKAWFSCYGFNSVDLGAPGDEIYSTKPNNEYQYLSGTSMATPHVSGVAALVMATYPYLTVDEVKNLILNSTDPIPSLTDITVTGGRANARNALNINDDQLKIYVSSPKPPYIFEGEAILLKATVSSGTSNVTGAAVRVIFSNGEPNVHLYDDGVHDDGTMNDGVYANYWTPTILGPCDLTFSAEYASRVIPYNIIERVDYNYDDAQVYNWIDATTGTAISLTDDSYVEIPIGFDFKFYGITHSSLKISSNGYLTFGTDGTDYTNDPIPSTNEPNNIIAPLWDDLNPSSGGSIYYLMTGTAPNRALTIEWYQVPRYPAIGAATFEVTLYESSNEMVFQYQDVYFEDTNYNEGRSATVGVEGLGGRYGTQYSYNSTSIYNYMAIRFFTMMKGTISGQVLLQGRTDHADLITFELRNPGEIVPVTTYQVDTAADGGYTLNDIRAGTYDLTAKASSFLRARQANITITSGQVTSDINFTLLGGDANADNSIGTADMLILKAAWLSNEGDPNWDSRADFNGDASIGTTDMLIMQGNWLKSGAE